MKIIWNNFDVVWIFCSFNDVFISSYSFKMFWELIGLLSSYHNKKERFLLHKELFLTQTHTSKLKHIERVILTHTTKGKLNKQSGKDKCLIRDTSVNPNTMMVWFCVLPTNYLLKIQPSVWQLELYGLSPARRCVECCDKDSYAIFYSYI